MLSVKRAVVMVLLMQLECDHFLLSRLFSNLSYERDEIYIERDVVYPCYEACICDMLLM